MNEKKNNNNNQSKSLNLNSYNVRYIYIVYILYSKANNNIYFHKSKDKRNPEKRSDLFLFSNACENNHKHGKKTFDWSTIFRTVF